MELTKWMQNWKLHPKTMSKKGDIKQHQDNFNVDLPTIQENIRLAYKKLKKLKEEVNRQDNWLLGIIQAQSKNKGTPIKALWKQHRLSEQARKMARLVRAALNSEPCPGTLNTVIGPNTNGQWQEFTTKHTLEKVCLEEAGCQFSQAS